MVWIEKDREDMKFLWIDGYPPEYGQILKKAKEVGGVFNDAEKMDKNVLFKELLSFTRYKYFKDQLGEDCLKLSDYDTYFFEFKRKSNELCITDLIWDDLQEGNRLGKNYSHIIFSVGWLEYVEGIEKKVTNIYRDIIKDFSFKIREPYTYKNIKLYEKSCKEILEKIGDFYIVPGTMCENMLDKLGFSSDSCGSF